MLAFLQRFRTRVVKQRKATTIDFSDTRRFVADAALLFYAELRRCVELTGGAVPIKCIPPRDKKCTQVLKQIGAFDILGFSTGVVPTYPDVIHWKVASGRQVEGEKYETILGSYDGRVAESLLDSLFRGLSEAMTNCHHHAYIFPRNDGLSVTTNNRDWWMFSQERDGVLSVAFCDLGAGIPRTLPVKKPALWRQVVGLGTISDADAIELAIQSSISRTGKRYRGKGLKQLLEAVEAAPEGALQIQSNYGCYTFSGGNTVLRNYSRSIMGTLIFWKLRISQPAATP